ncbi:alpha/beta hydrolase [Flavobacterium silvaticum]|uniref:Esterase n=1 Tax=Flavobacterium silvaticum TaxID=1852020 RepID=A0A972JG18_9FLAO|nr:dienelactone hydrolase family protein [Flavobacterium silvaticum]NMH28574.1 esterase [Flavobacterium silvaticum]
MMRKSFIFITIGFITITRLDFNMTPTDTVSLHYLVRKPKVKKEKTPLLILLHGVGSNEQNMFSMANSFPADFLVVSARGPITLGPNAFAWFQVEFTPDGPIINKEQAESSRKQLIQFIADLKKTEDFDPSQVYLLGFSQGGIMSYSVALTEPSAVKGIAVMSGRLLPEIKPIVASENNLEKLKVFISHGTNDQVLRFQYARDAVGYLKNKGINPEFHSYQDGHAINPEMLRDVVEWLGKH